MNLGLAGKEIRAAVSAAGAVKQLSKIRKMSPNSSPRTFSSPTVDNRREIEILPPSHFSGPLANWTPNRHFLRTIAHEKSQLTRKTSPDQIFGLGDCRYCIGNPLYAGAQCWSMVHARRKQKSAGPRSFLLGLIQAAKSSVRIHRSQLRPKRKETFKPRQESDDSKERPSSIPSYIR